MISPVPHLGAVLFEPDKSLAEPERMSTHTDDGKFVARGAGPQKYHRYIEQVGRESGVDANLLHAIVQVESNYDARAVSRAGAAGLMQLMPATARRFGVNDRFDPLQNLKGGASYLAWLTRHFQGDLELILAAYNAGEGAVRRHGNRIPPFGETRSYVQKVLSIYKS
ncbi:lytic transglycosylase domain-containing protein [Stenotrophomonas indicatrix]|uniref:lytic transglycosylase domain-containing protein n=1 Tax=Stenotrophomonas indicatrix TaxID=2045451 RepID=UPI00300B2B3E